MKDSVVKEDAHRLYVTSFPEMVEGSDNSNSDRSLFIFSSNVDHETVPLYGLSENIGSVAYHVG